MTEVLNYTATQANPEDVFMLKSNQDGDVPAAQAEMIIKDVMAQSTLMRLAKYVEMKDANGNPVQEKNFTFLADGLSAYWVNETEKIRTSKPTWVNAKLTSHKIGVIIPVSREFLYYQVPKFFDAIKPLVAEAFYKLFDNEGFNGTESIFTTSIAGNITASGNTVAGPLTYDTYLEALGTLYDDDVEPNALVASRKSELILRRFRDGEDKVYDGSTLDGLAVANFSGLAKGEAIIGDFNAVHYGIPYTMNYQISTDAQLSTIVNEDGTPVNLFEQEMIALRCTMDVAFMVSKEGAFAKVAGE